MIEISILVAAIVAGCIGIYLMVLGDNYDHGLMITSGFLIALISAIILILYAFLIWDWHVAEYKANIINREYNTKYTREEVFYAHDVIDTIQSLHRTRIELNGNLMQNQK